MLKTSNLLMGAAVAGLLGLGAVGVSTVPAKADTIQTRCSGYGDCYRVRCDDDGDYCTRLGYYNSGYYGNGYRRWVCDADGEDCHWVYYNGYYRHDYYRPGINFGFHF